MQNPFNKVITGHWGGQPIMRDMTVQEKINRDFSDPSDRKAMNFMATLFERMTDPRRADFDAIAKERKNDRMRLLANGGEE